MPDLFDRMSCPHWWEIKVKNWPPSAYSVKAVELSPPCTAPVPTQRNIQLRFAAQTRPINKSNMDFFFLSVSHFGVEWREGNEKQEMEEVGRSRVNWRWRKPSSSETYLWTSETHKNPLVLERKLLPGCTTMDGVRVESSSGIKARLVKATRLAAEWVRAMRKVTVSKKKKSREAAAI